MRMQNDVLKLGRRLYAKTPLLGARTRRAACHELAALKAAPFLVSALAHNDEGVRRIAEEELRAVADAEAIDALILGCRFSGEPALRNILSDMGRAVPDVIELDPSQPSPADEAWQVENAKDGTVLAFVPEGDFLAGEDAFRVHLPPYFLARAAVSNAQYAQFMTKCAGDRASTAHWILLDASSPIAKKGDAYSVDPEKANLPVRQVTWEGASEYCKWAELRLPTELEGEKGARGVDGRRYPWGDEWADGRPAPTGQERRAEEIGGVLSYPGARSPYGLYQMIGGVYEWCVEWYEEEAHKRYAKGDLKLPTRGTHRVLRGGPWRFGTPAYLRTEYRKGTVWRGGTLSSGFRCAMTL